MPTDRWGQMIALTTDCIAKEHREKVQNLILAEPLPHETHLAAEHIEEPVATQIAGNEDSFGKPRRNRRLRSGSGVVVCP